MKKDDVVIKKATMEDAYEIHCIMQEVYDRLEDKKLYVCDDYEFVKNHISENGFTVVACNGEGKIVGSFIFRYPGLSKDNLGRHIGLKDAQLSQVVHMESVVVLPEYWGHSLQSAMLNFAEDLIDKAQYRYFLATVSPDNPVSYQSFEKNGYRHMMTVEKYEGLMRRIYLKEGDRQEENEVNNSGIHIGWKKKSVQNLYWSLFLQKEEVRKWRNFRLEQQIVRFQICRRTNLK